MGLLVFVATRKSSFYRLSSVFKEALGVHSVNEAHKGCVDAVAEHPLHVLTALADLPARN